MHQAKNVLFSGMNTQIDGNPQNHSELIDYHTKTSKKRGNINNPVELLINTLRFKGLLLLLVISLSTYFRGKLNFSYTAY